MSGDIIIKKSTYNKIIVVIVAALTIAAFLGGYVVGHFGETRTAIQTPPQPIPTQAPVQNSQTRIAVSIGDNPVMGNSNAQVTMIEFSDFQCPFCNQFFSQTLPEVEKKYIDSGKVRLVFKNLPLENIHPNARAAAMAAECANEQGKFWDYHNKLFENQNNWAQLGSIDAAKAFKQYASDLGFDANSFNSCIDSGKYADKVNNDYKDGTNYGVTGTPTFFIGNDQKGYMRLEGAQPFPAFQQELDSELS